VTRSAAVVSRPSRLLALLLVSSAVGCDVVGVEGFADFGRFDEIPALEMLDYSNVEPARSYDVWELRESFEGVTQEVIGAGGTTGRGGLDPAVLAEFESIGATFGFGNYCLPGSCSRFIVSVRGDLIEVWRNAAEVRSFLGPIDTREDAILLALAHGYTWGDVKETAAIREVGTTYELVVVRMVKFCAPVETDRYLLQVRADGRLTELKSEIWAQSDACI